MAEKRPGIQLRRIGYNEMVEVLRGRDYTSPMAAINFLNSKGYWVQYSDTRVQAFIKSLCKEKSHG